MKTRLIQQAAVLCAAMVSAGAGAADTQNYPVRPVRLIVPFTPGSTTDIIARAVADRLSANLGQNVIVDNRAGAGGTIGTQAVVRAEPDGYTLLFAAPSELSVAAATVKGLPYDPLKDLQPISQVMRGPYVLVAHPSFGPNTIPELLAYAKKHGITINQ